MIDPAVRKMLDQTEIAVVQANYIRELTVSVLPRDRDKVVQFNDGTATLSQVEAWLRDHSQGQSRWSKAGTIIGALALVLPIVMLIVAIVALRFGGSPASP